MIACSYFVDIKIDDGNGSTDPETLWTMPSLREKLVTRALTVAVGLPWLPSYGHLWDIKGCPGATGAVPVTAPVTRRVSRDMREVQRETNSY